MRSIEDKGCLNLGSPQPQPQESIQHRRSSGLGKASVPSKWDDAQKWLSMSRGIDIQPRDSNADDTRLIAPLPKKDHHPYPTSNSNSSSEDEVELETKKVDSICVRDMGTEMTPLASQEPSRSATPLRASPPPPLLLPHPTTFAPQNQYQNQNQNQNQNESIRNLPRQDSNLNPLETRALAWDEAERAKYMARFKREEMKIEAWENHEKRKAEMEMKRMEGKAERMKTRAQEKYRNKVASTSRIAEEKRAKAEAVLNEKAVKTCEKADYIRRTGHLPSLSLNLPSSCCC